MDQVNTKKLKILICGYGSIGQRYVRILRQHFHVDLLLLRQKGRGNSFRIPEAYGWDEVRAYAPDIAFITNPTNLHMPVALKAVLAGAHIFLEKPISHSLVGINTLEQACKAHKKVCYVAYTLRFVPIVKLAKKLLEKRHVLHGRAVSTSSLLRWRKGRDVLKSYSSHAKQGGGVILEISHEFDLMNYLMGDVKQITGWNGRVSNITVDAEDIADALMQFKNKAHANVHLNFMSQNTERFFHIEFKGGFLRGDLLNHILIMHHQGKEQIYHLPCERDDYFKDQIDFFLMNLNNPKMMNNLTDAKELFEKIIKFRR